MKQTIHNILEKVLQKIIDNEVIVFPKEHELEIEILNTLVYNFYVESQLKIDQLITILNDFLTLDQKSFFKKRINFETILIYLKNAIEKTDILSIKNELNENLHIKGLIKNNFNVMLMEIAESQLED